MATVSLLIETVCELRMSARRPGYFGEHANLPSYVYTYTPAVSTNRKCLKKATTKTLTVIITSNTPSTGNI